MPMSNSKLQVKRLKMLTVRIFLNPSKSRKTQQIARRLSETHKSVSIVWMIESVSEDCHALKLTTHNSNAPRFKNFFSV